MSQTARDGQAPEELGPIGVPRALASVGEYRPPVSEPLRLARAMAEVAASVERDGLDLGERLQAVTDGAAEVIPGVGCSAVVVADGPQRLAARAVRGDLPAALMGLQNQIGQGPCLTAVAQTEQVWVQNIVQDPRWPQFGPRAAALGAHAMICTPLLMGNTVLGSLSLVSTTVDAFDEESVSLASIFAGHAATALAAAEGRRQLSAAVSSRDVIGQAKGMLMERYRMSADAAFAVLLRTSQTTNVKLRDVAEELCRSRTLPTLQARDSVRLESVGGTDDTEPPLDA